MLPIGSSLPLPKPPCLRLLTTRTTIPMVIFSLIIHLGVLKRRTKIPLAELMDSLTEAKEYLPLVKVMPEKLSNVELAMYELRDQLRS